MFALQFSPGVFRRFSPVNSLSSSLPFVLLFKDDKLLLINLLTNAGPLFVSGLVFFQL